MEQETPETRKKLADAIRTLQSRGDTATINRLVTAYKSKYQSGSNNKPVEKSGIIGSEQNFGQSIADAFYSGKAAKDTAKNIQSHSNDIEKLTDLRKSLTAEGKDTSHVDTLLQKMMKENPTSYGGDISAIIPSINKSTKQIVGEASGVFTDLLTGAGALSPTVAGAALGLTHALQQDKGVGGTLVDTAVGALGGKILQYGFDKASPFIEKAVMTYGTPLLEKLTKYIPQDAIAKLQTLAEKATIGEGTGGTDLINKVNNAVDAPIDKSFEYLSSKTKSVATDIMEKYKAKQGISDMKNIDKLSGMISQASKEDIDAVTKSLGDINISGIKTNQDLVDTLDAKISTLASHLDESLNKIIGTKKTADLHKSVSEAITQLENHYTSINDETSLNAIQAIKAKAEDTGLTVKEINDLARLHGRDLSGFNANGELASGLNKQAAENTRKALKKTARELFGNKVYQATDEKIGELMTTRDLIQKNVDAVQKLSNKIQERGLGEKAGRLVGKVINLVGLGSPKGLVESFLSRGTGLKTLNALDLESMLSKNLSKLQKLIERSGTISEVDFIKELQAIYPKTLYPQLEAPKAGSVKESIDVPMKGYKESQSTIDSREKKTINNQRSNQELNAGNIDNNKVIPDKTQQNMKKSKTSSNVISDTIPYNKEKVNSIVFYHGTSKADAESIIKNGFNSSLSKKGNRKESPYALFASTEPKSGSDHFAGAYGDSIVKVTPKVGVDIKVLDQNKDWKIYNETFGSSTSVTESAKWVKELKNKGYDVIKEVSGETIILSPEKFNYSKYKSK